MPPSSRIPPLLQPYTRLPPKNSLILLSSVLGASANWLVIRFLCDALTERERLPPRTRGNPEYGGLDAQNSTAGGSAGIEDNGEVAVVLVSWMRDWEFWKTEGRKGGGLDLNRLQQEKRFVFVDGLSNLFLPSPEAPAQAPTTPPTAAVHESTSRTTTLPIRSPRSITPRTSTLPSSLTEGTPEAQTTPSIPAASQTSPSPSQFKLTSPTLQHLEETIQSAIKHPNRTTTASNPKILLILDQPDFLLAAAGLSPTSTTNGSPTSNPITPSTLPSAILRLRRLVHATLCVVSADTPLVSSSSGSIPPVPLETNGAAFVIGMAHVAERVMSLRLLDTGVARDVSGVLRVTVRGGEDVEEVEEDEEDREEVEEKEMLYYVGGDGSVRVFERGGGS